MDPDANIGQVNKLLATQGSFCVAELAFLKYNFVCVIILMERRYSYVSVSK
jgi:hypothetical protein